MTTARFSNLPAEIHFNIAEHCANNEIINLCLTSKLMYERCSWVLFRHVDLQLDQYGWGALHNLSYIQKLSAIIDRQKQFVRLLLSHPEYGKHIRFFKTKLWIPSFDNCHGLGENPISDDELWQAMRLLTRVRGVDIGSKNTFTQINTVPKIHDFPKNLFQSAISVRLFGCMPYGLAKSILNAINPATLKYLCLDMVQDPKEPRRESIVGDRGERGRIIALGATSGLLTTLTGRCTALQTLILRRIGQFEYARSWHTAAEEASYIEWGSFIHSVQGTLKNLIFEQARGWQRPSYFPQTLPELRIMDDRFLRLVLPAILSGNWPCLTNIEIRGVRQGVTDDEKAVMTLELRAAVGENAKILVEEEARYMDDIWDPYRWN